ncbi:MAG TPA: hypothetical protein VFA10_00010 [Ktedonobacteraceae bacterium]|nr:hypothetical protein [Ktedonobacteraceae bacterium]
MSAIETVKAFMTALEANDRKTAANYLSNDFAFIGWTPRPLNKDDFLTVMGGLKAGMPGLVFNLHDLREESNAIVGTITVYGSIQVVGHQTNAFNLPPLSLPPIPQMDGNVSLPTEQVEYRIENNQIVRWSVQRIQGGGIEGMLHQFGVESPIIQ